MRNNFLKIFTLIFVLTSCNSNDNMENGNNLKNESSPYLLQHAENPVNWNPWNQKYLDLAEKDNYESVNYTALMKNISGLDRRAQDIVRARWLDDQKLTLNELADKYSVSAERIRQIEASAFKKLKTSLVNV